MIRRGRKRRGGLAEYVGQGTGQTDLLVSYRCCTGARGTPLRRMALLNLGHLCDPNVPPMGTAAWDLP